MNKVEQMKKAIDRDVQLIYSKSICKPNNEFNRRMIKERIEDYLATLKENQVVNGFSVETKTIKETWTTLYPSVWKRILAFTATKLFGAVHSDQHWFHTVFPYIITYTIEREDDEVGLVVMDQYWAELRTPHEYIAADISIQPVTPVEFITLNMIIKKDIEDANKPKESN